MATTLRRRGAHRAATGRIAIIAGSGRLPVEIAEGLAARGQPPFVVMVRRRGRGSCAPSQAYPQIRCELEQVGSLVPLLKRQAHQPCRPGRDDRAPAEVRAHYGRSCRFCRSLPQRLPSLAQAATTACCASSSATSRSHGIKVVGAHEILPDLLAAGGRPYRRASRRTQDRQGHRRGVCGRTRHRRARHRPGGGRDRRPRHRAGRHRRHRRPARAGQRICAAMAALPARSAACWSNAPSRARNCAPICRRSASATVEAAHAAGLAGIGVEAERSLVLDFGDLIAARRRARPVRRRPADRSSA